jgi:hypothetical protein
VFNGTLTIENTEFDIIFMADGSGSNAFNGNIDLNSTGNSGGIYYGQNGGTSTLASTRTLTIGTSGFSAGDLRLANFTQAGSTSQSLTTFGTGVEVYLESGTIFNGSLTLTAPGIYLNGTTFNNNLTATKTSSIPNISAGGNVFNGTTIIANTGAGSMTLASSATDDFQENVTFLQSTAFTLFPAYSVNCTFSKNIITTGSATIVPFSNNGGRVTMTGGNAQTIQGDVARPPDFGNLTINKSSNGVTLNVPITINNGGNLTLTSGVLTTTSSNLLAMADNSTVSGTSNSSYVSGPCRKEGNDAFTFPVGKGGYYRPIAISAPANVISRFTGEFFLADSDGSYTHSSKDVSLNHLSRCEYWILDRNAGTNSVTVTLSWNTPSCGVTVLGDLRVARWNGTTWKDHGNGSTTGNTTSGTVASSAAISSFSPFTLGSTTIENPLPVNLIDFQASPADGKVLIEWTTVSETNNDYFSIEASNDAVSFQEIARISGAGNSNSILNYRTFDYSPNPDVSYYRLKQVDFDGKFMYSGIRVVNMPTLWENEMVLSPNPVVNIVDVRLDKDRFSKPSIEIRDIQGKLLLKHEVLEINPQIPVRLDLSNYPQGLYFINVKENSVSITRRLIKN